MKKKVLFIIIILVNLFIIWFFYRLYRLPLACNMELLFHEKEYKSIIESVKKELYSSQESYAYEHIYIYNDKIVIEWEKNNDKHEIICSKNEKLEDYPELKNEIVSLLGKNFMRMHFVIDKNGKISAKIPFQKVSRKKRGVDDKIEYSVTINYELVYIEAEFLKKESNEGWIAYFNNTLWKNWGYDCNRG